MVGVLHQSFNNYPQRLARELRDEWAKVQGRFVNLAISVAVDEQLELCRGRSRRVGLSRGSMRSRQLPRSSALAEPAGETLARRFSDVGPFIQWWLVCWARCLGAASARISARCSGS